MIGSARGNLWPQIAQEYTAFGYFKNHARPDDLVLLTKWFRPMQFIHIKVARMRAKLAMSRVKSPAI
jgi:hypothetical protein